MLAVIVEQQASSFPKKKKKKLPAPQIELKLRNIAQFRSVQ